MLKPLRFVDVTTSYKDLSVTKHKQCESTHRASEKQLGRSLDLKNLTTLIKRSSI